MQNTSPTVTNSGKSNFAFILLTLSQMVILMSSPPAPQGCYIQDSLHKIANPKTNKLF